MSVFENDSFDNHEKVVFCRDEQSGLSAIIAVHSTALGPGCGGCRMWDYATSKEALTDVLRLSKAMSYKNAMAGLRFGGGKAVIMKNSRISNVDALFTRFGEFIESLGGAYVTAEDVGMTDEIMQIIARQTSYVSGLPPKEGAAGGDPSPVTAYGVFCGIQAAVKARLGKDELAGLKIAVQGLGNVGYNLCKLLHEAGAELLVADINAERVKQVSDEFSAQPVAIDEILYQDVDVLAPCALGAILNEQSIPEIKAKVVAGGANNQLATDADGQRLLAREILYAPDYVINAGGVINIAAEYYGDQNESEVMRSAEKIGDRLTGIFEESARQNLPTNEIADRKARELISRS